MSVITPATLLEALRDWRVPVRPYEPDGLPWYGNTTAGGWNPHGVMHHHTGGSARLLTDPATIAAMLRILRNGRAGLTGPLTHMAPAMDPETGQAVVHLVGWGNVNHAGMGSHQTLDAVIAETYNGQAPGADDIDGNPAYYALEYLHPGDATAWPDELLEVGHLAASATCDAHGWTAASNVEHREHTRRKIDRSWPGDVRAEVGRLLTVGPSRPVAHGGKVPGASAPIPAAKPAAKPAPEPSPLPGVPVRKAKFPGRSAFGYGRTGEHILALGSALVLAGYGSHYRSGPTREWGPADQAAVAAFQRNQGWRGADADGIPGPQTWHRLGLD